jgi:pimeloyl-ACP methyl ester carboxylesterase
MTKHQTIHIEGHTLAVLPINPGAKGEPVFLVHGITSSIASWEVNLLPILLQQGECYALSLPGHFPAAFPVNFKKEQLTAETMTRIMAEAIRHVVGERPVTLIGHSTGGFAILNIAARYPQMVRRVVSISGFAHGRWIGLLGFQQRLVRMGRVGKALYKMMYHLSGLSAKTLRMTLRIYAANAKALFANPDVDEVVGKSISNFRHLNLDTMVQYFSVMPDIDITASLPQIQAPTLVIAGDRDPTVPMEESRRIASMTPNAELVLIHNAGHLPYLECPIEYQAALTAWLQKTR